LTISRHNVPYLFVSPPDDIDDLAMLAEFAQLALERARAASRRAEAVEAEGGDPQVHLVAFDRMGRALRLALSLRRRLADEAQRRSDRRVQARKEALSAALKPAIRLHADFSDRQDLDWALAHRLETEAETLASLPFEAGVARLAEMLGLPLQAHAAEPAEHRDAGPDSRPAENRCDLPTPDRRDRACRVAARATATGPP
jgi:hypothetical protein